MVFTDSAAENSLTSETERAGVGLSRSSSRAVTEFDFPESLTEERSAEITVDDQVKVCPPLIQSVTCIYDVLELNDRGSHSRCYDATVGKML